MQEMYPKMGWELLAYVAPLLLETEPSAPYATRVDR